MDRSNKESFQTEDTYQLFQEFIRVIQRITFTNNTVGKILVGKWAIPSIARVWGQFMLSQVTGLSRSSSEFLLTKNNFTEWGHFFSLTPDERQVALNILPYVNRAYGNINELEPLILEANKLEDAITDQIRSWIVPVRGLREPQRVLELTQKLFNCDTGNGTRRWDAAYLAYNFLIRQISIEDDWLSVYRNFMRITIDEGQHGYAIAISKRSGLKYRFYVLWFYVALWNRKYPYAPVDLIDEYLDRAVKRNDLNLLLYIIDCFSDQERAKLPDYRIILSSLAPFVPTNLFSPMAQVEEHLARALAKIRSNNPSDIDYFLQKAKAKRSFREQVQSMSLEQPIDQVYLNMTSLMVSFFAYAPTDVVQLWVEIVKGTAKEDTLGKAIQHMLIELITQLDK